MIDEDDEIGSDYINASYIRVIMKIFYLRICIHLKTFQFGNSQKLLQGYTGEVEYIATQGPLESTCRDFWKMILQENVSMIIMVSLFIEQDKVSLS